MSSPEPSAVSELLAAAEDMLNFGTHDGPCEFSDGKGCAQHLKAVSIRSTRLERAIAACRFPATEPATT